MSYNLSNYNPYALSFILILRLGLYFASLYFIHYVRTQSILKLFFDCVFMTSNTIPNLKSIAIIITEQSSFKDLVSILSVCILFIFLVPIDLLYPIMLTIFKNVIFYFLLILKLLMSAQLMGVVNIFATLDFFQL